VIRELPRAVCPESKVTGELADKRSLGLWPIVVTADECQRWFEHKRHGEVGNYCRNEEFGFLKLLIFIKVVEEPSQHNHPYPME